MSVRHLTASRRRLRKEQLARRHGARCTYCRRPFASPREATLDHIAPHSLFPTWSVVHLTLACEPCNHAKADRLPLSMALLLTWWTAPNRPTVHSVDGVDVHGFHPVFTDPQDAFTPAVDRAPGSPAGVGKPLVGSGGSRVNSRPTSTRSPSIDWRLLARLAHAHQSATRTPLTATRTVTRTPERSRCDLRVHRGRTATCTATTRLCGDGRTAA
ncbi:HNH endonuclease [Streptomyces sp. NBC_01224]|uniref:HNH endonuclease n=1 Tax=Streptomyces sp. NBC_01224 TaxID=2903783 RepID=UPI002E12653B|nr:HNH endonuclease [Streptomyces sp. NBC_01224]